MMAKEFERVKLEEETVRRTECWLNGTGLCDAEVSQQQQVSGI